MKRKVIGGYYGVRLLVSTVVLGEDGIYFGIDVRFRNFRFVVEVGVVVGATAVFW